MYKGRGNKECVYKGRGYKERAYKGLVYKEVCTRDVGTIDVSVSGPVLPAPREGFRPSRQ